MPKKFADKDASFSSFNSSDDEDYEILPEKELKELREELKKNKEFDVAPSKRLHVSINELNSKLDKLISIFDEASRDMKVEEGGLSFQDKMRPLAEKMNKILEQNSEIAEGIVALADIVKDFREDLETKGITVAEKRPLFAESPPQITTPPAEPQPFPPRMQMSRPVGEQMMRVAPPPFEAPKPPSSPPPMAPPKKRLFGL